jgi:hypothetical protein
MPSGQWAVRVKHREGTKLPYIIFRVVAENSGRDFVRRLARPRRNG